MARQRSTGAPHRAPPRAVDLGKSSGSVGGCRASRADQVLLRITPSFSERGAAVLGCRSGEDGNALRTGCMQCPSCSLSSMLAGKTRSRHPCAPYAGMRCGLPASSRQCGRCLGWSSTYAEAADTSEPPNASPIPHHRSGFDRRAAYDIPCFVPALANADDPNMDDQPKTRLICRRCAARMKLARQLPWLDHKLPAILLFQCIDCGHVDMVEWPEPEGE